MSGRARNSGALLGCSLLAGALCAASAGGPLRAALGIPLVLLLPGAALLSLLDLRLPPANALLAALAASVAITVVIGLGLGAAHTGFSARTWGISLGAVAALLSGASLLRGMRRGRPAATRAALVALARPAAALCCCIALVTVAAAIAIAHRSAVRHDRSVAFAELWSTGAQVGLSTHPGRANLLRLTLEARSGRHLRSVLLSRGGSFAEPMPAGGRALLFEGQRMLPSLEVGSTPPARARHRPHRRGHR